MTQLQGVLVFKEDLVENGKCGQLKESLQLVLSFKYLQDISICFQTRRNPQGYGSKA